MRDPQRIPEVLAKLGLYWQKHPDLRLGQILGNFDIDYSTEDEVLVEALNKAWNQK